MRKNLLTEKPKDLSLFTRWVKKLDDKDKSLSRVGRKRKWMLIVTGIFFLFVLSFVVCPTSLVERKELDTSSPEIKASSRLPSVRSAFVLPVDSFKIHLKQVIDETSKQVDNE